MRRVSFAGDCPPYQRGDLKMRPRATLACVFLVLIGVAAPATAGADPCVGRMTALRPCFLPAACGTGTCTARGGGGFDSLAEPWDAGKRRDGRKKFGFVRENERSAFAITLKGLRFTLKF